MNIVIGIVGFAIGLFLWSSVLGSLFATLPLQKQLKKAGEIKDIHWASVLLPILFAGVVLGLTAIFAKTFFYGSLVGGVCMLFNIGKLKREAFENYQNERKAT